MSRTTGATKRVRVAKPSEQRLQDLLDAALTVYTDKGVAGATVQEITERAGVAKGTFYLYFESKAHAVGVLWERYVNGLLDIAERTLDRSDGAGIQAAISAFIASLTDHALAHTELHRIVYRSADAVALELCRAVNEQVVTRLAEAIERGVRAGTLHATNPQLTARLLYHGAHEALHDAVSGSLPRLGRDDLVASFQEIAERALSTPAADRLADPAD